MKIRVATFNCENLFARFRFKKNIDPDKAAREGWAVDKTKFDSFTGTERKLTADVIKATKADVIALQEVENIEVLKKFRTKYLGGRKKYPYVLLIDGNDPRFIDVAVLSKYPLKNIDTHINEYVKGKPVFSRDCLECDVIMSQSKSIRLYVNHFKSMMDKSSKCNGREKTKARRKSQVNQVKKIINAKKKPGNFVILGDFNDYRETDSQGISAILSLVDWNKIHDVAQNLDAKDRWTHYWKGNKPCGIVDAYKQLDYILISKSLEKNNKNVKPDIIRIGMTTNAKKYTGTRLKGVTKTRKASDHAPMAITLEV